MSFMAPLFLLGALAIALPLWLHRLQSKSSVRQKFSSAMLLEAAAEQIHVKREYRYLALLALRVLLLALLAFAFARPLWERVAPGPAAASGGTELMLLDLSMSMGLEGVLEEAKASARRIIDATPAGSLSLILAARDDVKAVTSLQDSPAAQRRSAASLTASALRSDLGAAMAAVEAHAAGLPGPVTLHVISDFQVSAMPTRFADLIPANIAKLMLHPTASRNAANGSVQFIRQIDDGIEAGILTGGAAGDEVAVRLSLNDVQTFTERASGIDTQLLRFPGMQYEPGDNRISVSLTAGDGLAADNERFFVVENKPVSPVPLITLNAGGLPVTYLSAALESAAGGFRAEPLLAGSFDRRILPRYPWLIVDDLGLADQQLENVLLSYLRDGGSVLAFAGDRAFGADSLPVSGHRLGAASLGGNGFLSIGQVDTTHPALSATSGWHSVNISRSLPLDPLPDDRVLIRLENDEAFLIERHIGAGRLLLVANGAGNRWNDLPLQPVFVAFIAEVANYLAGRGNLTKIYTTGDRLPLSLIGSASGQVVDPDGNTVLSLADTARAQLVRLDKPGIYEVYTPQGEARIAVNVDPRESELEQLAPEVLRRWQDAVAGQPRAADGVVAASAEPDAAFELWHWLLLLLALLAIGESVLGNRYLTTRAT